MHKLNIYHILIYYKIICCNINTSAVFSLKNFYFTSCKFYYYNIHLYDNQICYIIDLSSSITHIKIYLYINIILLYIIH